MNIVLTDEQREALTDAHDHGYKYIALDEDDLFPDCYKLLPKKKTGGLGKVWDDENDEWKRLDYIEFDFINWSDDKPWSIKSLLGSVEVKPETNTNEKGMETINAQAVYDDKVDIVWNKKIFPEHSACENLINEEIKSVEKQNITVNINSTFLTDDDISKLIQAVNSSIDDGYCVKLPEDNRKTVPHLTSLDNPYNGYDPMGFYK